MCLNPKLQKVMKNQSAHFKTSTQKNFLNSLTISSKLLKIHLRSKKIKDLSVKSLTIRHQHPKENWTLLPHFQVPQWRKRILSTKIKTSQNSKALSFSKWQNKILLQKSLRLKQPNSRLLTKKNQRRTQNWNAGQLRRKVYRNDICELIYGLI